MRLVAIYTFANAHEDLLRGNAELHLPPAADDPALEAIYFEEPRLLDAEVTNFIARARRIVLMPPGASKGSRDSVLLLASARTRIFDDLGAVVAVHEREAEEQLVFLDRVQTVMLVIVLATLLFEAVGIFQPMVRRIVRNTSELDLLASTDPLTGALNRRSFFQRGQVELERTLRYGRPLTMLVIDVDHFKTAEALANRLRIEVSRLSIPTQQGVATITVSVGAAGSDVASLTIKSLFERADKALYTAKRRGRNQVVAAEAA